MFPSVSRGTEDGDKGAVRLCQLDPYLPLQSPLLVVSPLRICFKRCAPGIRHGEVHYRGKTMNFSLAFQMKQTQFSAVFSTGFRTLCTVLCSAVFKLLYSTVLTTISTQNT